MPDFTAFLTQGEQILWQDASSNNAPEPDVKNNEQNKYIYIFMLLCGIALTTIGIAGRLDGIDKLGCAVVGVFAVILSCVMMIYHKSYKQQYYCLTNKRLLIADARGIIEHALIEAQSAAVTKTNGEYGSLLIFTRMLPQNIYWEHFNRRNMNGVTYDRQIWSIRGVKDADRLCVLLNYTINSAQTAMPQDQNVYNNR